MEGEVTNEEIDSWLDEDEDVSALENVLTTGEILAAHSAEIRRLREDVRYLRERCSRQEEEIDTLKSHNKILQESTFDRIVGPGGVIIQRDDSYGDILVGMRLSTTMFMRTAGALDRDALIHHITTNLSTEIKRKLDIIYLEFQPE